MIRKNYCRTPFIVLLLSTNILNIIIIYLSLLLLLIFSTFQPFINGIKINKMSFSLPTFFLAHGGGPMPILDMKTHGELSEFLIELPKTYIPRRPKQIIVISAHWESTSNSAIQISTGHENGELLYDYYGFPPQAYAPHLTYKVNGALELSSNIYNLFKSSSMFENVELVSRGFDHGVFIPLKLMYPEADIPVIQISLIGGLNPTDHVNLGKILSKVREDNNDVLIIGSGMSFHNMRAFGGGSNAMEKSVAFHNYLKKNIETNDTTNMINTLLTWEDGPEARFCHPREEHLIPLHVAAASAGPNANGKMIYDNVLMGVKVASFMFE